MNIGLIDVDGHNFPNLALMRISAWHKSQGDNVEWAVPMCHYDIVYQSKIYSDTYSKDIDWTPQADVIYKGGTGYAISLVDGKEVYDKSKDTILPDYIEHMFPDYSIYPQYEYAVSMTSRGCPRGCKFCHVATKEGRCSVKVADVKDFWNGQKEIQILDSNILACKEKEDLLHQYLDTKARLEFKSGFDIRLMREQDAHLINQMKIKQIHFAWDNPNDDLTKQFEMFGNIYRRSRKGMVYCLTGFEDCTTEEHLERALKRIYWLRDHKYDPFVMLYNKPNADHRLKQLQRWCNNKFVFKKCLDFNDYDVGVKNE